MRTRGSLPVQKGGTSCPACSCTSYPPGGDGAPRTHFLSASCWEL
uniref:Uncharacterized protein n=1 Tax=Trichinella nativa TaxID=6335 RepID=A0A0V1JYN5_9BILA